MSHVLAWICLVLVACTAAYGVQLMTTAIVPASSAEAEQVVSVTPTRTVSIVGVDPVTGDRAQMVCQVPANSFATDIVLVDAADFPAVVRACVNTDTPVVRSGSPY
jgi:hypothetical protein